MKSGLRFLSLLLVQALPVSTVTDAGNIILDAGLP